MNLERRKVINDAFLVTLFQIMVESPQMTATEAMLRAQEKGALLAPTMGRQQSEFLGPRPDPRHQRTGGSGMNLLSRIALAAIALAVLVWSVGGFIIWDWNLVNWSEVGRSTAVYFWVSLTGAAGLFIGEASER